MAVEGIGRRDSRSGLNDQARIYLESRSSKNASDPYSQSVEEARWGQCLTAGVIGAGTPDLAGTRDLVATCRTTTVPLREYRPHNLPTLPGALVFIHGGGWAVGDLATYDELCARLAIASQSVVYSVDYRRAPEEPFPAAVQDTEAATRWLLEQANNLGINPHGVVIAGDSAGGNLAAVVARRLRDRPPSGGACLLGQLLIYPVTDGRMNSASYAQFSVGYGLTKRRMEWYWDMYCPDPEQRRHPDASPILAAELVGLPPMVVVVATHDPLHDEVREYADAALNAGVRVEVLEAKGQLHGFIRCTGIIDEAVNTIDRLGAAVIKWAEAAEADSKKQHRQV